MADAWDRFRERIEQGDPVAPYVKQYRAVAPLLDLPLAEAVEKILALTVTMDETGFAALHPALTWMSNAAAYSADMDAIDSAEAARYRRLLAIRTAVAEVRVAERQPEPLEATDALSEAATELWHRLFAVTQTCFAATTHPSVVDDALAVIDECRRTVSAWDPSSRSTRKIEDTIARATQVVASALATMLRYDEARCRYRESLRTFRAQGNEREANDCARRLRELDALVSGDVDLNVRSNLALLAEMGAAPASLERAKALADLMHEARMINDFFGLRKLLDQTLAELACQNYDDPGLVDVETAFAAWVNAVPSALQGSAFFGALCRVVGLYQMVSSARVALGSRVSARQAERARMQIDRLAALAVRMNDVANDVQADLNRDFQRMSGYELGWIDELARKQKLLGAQLDEHRQMLMALVRGFRECSAEINRRIERGEPLNDLLANVDRLDALAVTGNDPEYAARFAILRSEILLEMNEPVEGLDVLTAARRALRAAHGVDGVDGGSSPYRAVDVAILQAMASAHMKLGDAAAASAAFGEAIDAVERDRYGVSDPHQQSAFLSSRANLYRGGVVLAHALEDYDVMMQRIELSKARSLLRARYRPGSASSADAELERTFRELCDEIDAARARDAGRVAEDLLARRRRTWDLLALQRYQTRGEEPPPFAIADVQQALEPDQVAISYYWAFDDRLIIVGVDRSQYVVVRISLAEGQRETLDRVVSRTGTLGAWTTELDAGIRSSAPLLLPPGIAELIDGNRRLIVSPHGMLHQFPFHALPWKDGYVVEQFAVAYAPNLSSIAAPARPAAEPNVLVAGIDRFDVPGTPLSPLPRALEEAAGIARTYADAGFGAELLSGAEMTRAELERRSDAGTLEHVTCLHVATHAESVLDTKDEPMESCIYLRDTALDGLEIARLRLSADLVVLSACHAGRRAPEGRGLSEPAGDEVLGLQAAFAMAGTAAVLGALWQVGDEAAASIMIPFHRNVIAGEPADVALQKAILGYRRSNPPCTPASWAPFFLTVLQRTSSRCGEVFLEL